MKNRWRWILGGLGLWAAVATAATYHVDGHHPDASDDNPGTIVAPFKTLRHAGDIARPGDTVRIRGGVYRETLKVRGPNQYPAEDQAGARRVIGRMNRHSQTAPLPRIVFEAYGDEAVTIDGSEAVRPEDWEAVPERAGVYVLSVEAALAEALNAAGLKPADFKPSYVFWNDARLFPYRERDEIGLWKHTVPTADAAPAYHFDDANRRLYVALGGVDPRRAGRVELAVRRFGVDASQTRHVTLRRLTIRRAASWGVWGGYSEGLIVEDCQVVHGGWVAIRVGSSENVTVRRCRVHDVEGIGIDPGSAQAAVIYDNVVSDFALGRRGYYNYAYQVFGGTFCRFYHNVAIQSDRLTYGGGFWTDCPGVGHIWMGNAAVRSEYYIEAPSCNNLVQWNTAWHSRHVGIHLRQNLSNLVCENLVAYCGMAGLALGSTEAVYPTVAGNVFVRNWLLHNRVGVQSGNAPGRPGEQSLNFAQANVYAIPADGIAALWAGRPYRTLGEFRGATGQETLGRETAIDLDELGLVWVRADGPDSSHRPFPMFFNPAFNRMGSQTGIEPFFWRRGDDEGTDHFPMEWFRPDRKYRLRDGFSDEFARGPVRDHRGQSAWFVIAPVEGTPVGGIVLHVESFDGFALDARGLGCWSPSLPTVGGAEMDLALWMKPMDVAAAEDGGGAVVFVEWSDWTGQQKTRGYLVGGSAEDEVRHPELSRGRADWTRVAGRLTAPGHARRFALYLGLRNASGQVQFGAVEEIRTLPGGAPPPAAAGARAQTPPRFDPATLSFATVDLSAVVNRPLADEEADDGRGGWTDQGSGYDMRGLDTGRQTHEGVPYELLTPDTCVVLNSRRFRPQSPLPAAVDIPVGARADALYFLQSGAWISEGEIHWTYEIHYADGHREDLPVIGGVNVRDWSQAGEPYEFPDTDNRRTTVWPQFVGNTLSPTCGLYAMEWRNPKPETVIDRIVMRADPRSGVPILLAITRGTKK